MRAWRGALAAAVLAAALIGCTEQSTDVRLVPNDDDFGAQAVGATSAPHQLTLVNTGSSSTYPLVVELTLNDAGDFALAEDTCAGRELPSGLSCHLRLTFTPTALGPRQAVVSIHSGPATVTAILRGTGADAPMLGLSPASDPHDFGPVLAGGPGKTDVFQVRNDGGVAGPALAVSISGADASMFVLGDDRCTGQAVGPGGSCTFAVSFRPPLAASGVRSAAVQAGGGLGVALTGNAIHVASLAWTPASHDYGPQPVSMDSSAGDFVFQLSNQGNLDTSAVTLSTTGDADFQLRASTCGTNGAFTLAPGASCAVTVRFVASTTGARQGSLVATASAGGPSGVAADLDGTGQ